MNTYIGHIESIYICVAITLVTNQNCARYLLQCPVNHQKKNNEPKPLFYEMERGGHLVLCPQLMEMQTWEVGTCPFVTKTTNGEAKKGAKAPNRNMKRYFIYK